MIADKEKVSCAVCKFQFDENSTDLIMKLHECKPPSQHLIHAVCFAKDLATLKVLGPQCPICQLDAVVTIHDTDCLDTVEFSGQLGSCPDKDFKSTPQIFQDVDMAVAVTDLLGQHQQSKKVNLMVTNPLDQVIDSDEEIY